MYQNFNLSNTVAWPFEDMCPAYTAPAAQQLQLHGNAAARSLS